MISPLNSTLQLSAEDKLLTQNCLSPAPDLQLWRGWGCPAGPGWEPLPTTPGTLVTTGGTRWAGAPGPRTGRQHFLHLGLVRSPPKASHLGHEMANGFGDLVLHLQVTSEAWQGCGSKGDSKHSSGRGILRNFSLLFKPSVTAWPLLNQLVPEPEGGCQGLPGPITGPRPPCPAWMRPHAPPLLRHQQQTL